jgi:site-specific DNA-methyltransferase (adenine-specific)
VNNDALLSSSTDEWATPAAIVEDLAARFGAFTLDPCATPWTAKALRYFTRDDDGLTQSWAGSTVFMNPPYGRVIGRWVAKAHHEARANNARVICLIPARTDTRYWHQFVMSSEVVLFACGRIYFGDGHDRAPFPSAAVVFDRAGTPGAPRFESWDIPHTRADRRDTERKVA